MFFHTFDSQQERRAFGGSCFIEIQVCRLPADCNISTLVDIDSVDHWRLDSLYCADENAFYEIYAPVFGDGVYNNRQSGPVDIYGINYYSPHKLEAIVRRLREMKPAGFEEFLFWLANHKPQNGIYVLGI